MNFLRSVALAVAAIAALGAQLPQFEVVSIKPSDPSAAYPGRFAPVPVDTAPGRLTARNATLKDLIMAAYALEDYQVSGGPGWIISARFEVEAKPSASANSDQLLLMLRTLLADRFQLAVHHETRDVAIYALVVAKNGPKFQSSKPGVDRAPGRLNDFRPPNLPFLARFLTHLGSDKPVIDKTGLTGNFDLDLDMEKIGAEASSLAGGTPHLDNMFEAATNAIQDGLGLKLVPTRAPVEILVVDRAERPSEN